ADFATGEAPIEVALERAGGDALLRFGNTGPLLPDDMKDRLFESMVSLRREGERAEPRGRDGRRLRVAVSPERLELGMRRADCFPGGRGSGGGFVRHN